jgi:hypothetical protein
MVLSFCASSVDPIEHSYPAPSATLARHHQDVQRHAVLDTRGYSLEN